MMRKAVPITLFCFCVLLFTACKHKRADLLVTNGIIHTMDSVGTVVQAMAITDGKVIATGRSEDLMFEYNTDSIWDLKGQTVLPGLIDAHCHFYGFAMNQKQADLRGTDSWEAVVAILDSFAVDEAGEWVLGRGWDQNDWIEKRFPDNRLLNERFPDRPVLVRRIDGHAAVANQVALERAGIYKGQRVSGGRIMTYPDGQPNGILIDNAVDLVEREIPPPSRAEIAQALKKAEGLMFQAGLTTLDDAGLDLHVIELIDSLQKAGILKIRIYAMANPTEENFDRFLPNGPYKTDRLTVSSFKIYADGALGSRGACLIEPYKDDQYERGFLLNSPDYYRDIAQRLYKAGFQMNTHCIGDSANRLILQVYGEVLEGKNDRRWRIEHAQVVHPDDFALFGIYSIIPSVQPTHAISDHIWAEDRLGKDRIQGAYAYNTLYKSAGTVVFGTDFPVEHYNPMNTLAASILRTDSAGFPYQGFLPHEAVGFDTAMRAMTIWAAKANFEDRQKGSLEPGKLADFIVVDHNPYGYDSKLLQRIKVLNTVIGGERVYGE